MSDPSPADVLVAAIAARGDAGLLVVTGAGISVASGIPTFRGSDPDAIWSRDVTELGTRDYFERDPVGSWRWYLQRFDRVLDARPNAAHEALAALEEWQVARGGDFLLVSQNVDTLHERAGSRRLVKVHGSADQVRCARVGCVHGAPRGTLPRESFDLAAFRAEPCRDHLPRCPACAALLRQHVLWFDERYDEHESYQLPRVMTFAARAGLTLFVGTSFSVGITDLLVSTAWRHGGVALAVDPAAPAHPTPGVRFLTARAEEVLPEVVDRLRRAPRG